MIEKTVVFHNHMDHEKTGMIMVSENGAESGAVQVRLLDDGSFDPSDISARPRCDDRVDQRVPRERARRERALAGR